MSTVMGTPAWECAIREVGLIPSTAKVVHPDLSGSLTKVSARPDVRGSAISQLPADDIAIIDVPEVVTDCAPLATVIDFNATFIGVSTTNKSYGKI